MATAMYVSLSYEDYKNIEKQMRDFAETSHNTEPGFYHKSIRLKITDGLVLEFHGPLVKAAELVAKPITGQITTYARAPSPIRIDRNSR